MERKFKANIGDRIIDDYKDITIIDRCIIVKKTPSKKAKRGYIIENRHHYRYKCNRCGWESKDVYDKYRKYHNYYWTYEHSLFSDHFGCGICGIGGGKAIVSPQLNSIISKQETHWMIKYFQGVTYDEKTKEASKYTPQSNIKYKFICPDCGVEKECAINKLYKNHSIGCICKDNVSFPNKYAFAFFKQLPILNYKREYSPDWAKEFKYDNYFEYNGKSYIVEMDGGLGHGNRKYKSKEADIYGKQRDIVKDGLALINDVEIIRIDCLQSDGDYIQNNIEDSVLSEIFDLSEIDWKYCKEFATKNLIKEVCNYYNEHDFIENQEIAKVFGLNTLTIGRYLKSGNDLGWCNYDFKEKHLQQVKKLGFNNGYKIQVYKDNVYLGTYNSASEIDRKSENDFGTKLWQTQICICCKTGRLHKGFNFKKVE